MTQFSKGLGDVVWASSFLARTPGLWMYLVLPVLTAALIASATLYFLFNTLMGYAASLTGYLPSWSHAILGTLVDALVLVFLGAIGYVLFLATTALVTAPFCEQLSEKVEELLGGQASPPFSLRRFLTDLALGIGHSIRRVGVYLATMGGLFVLPIVLPGFGAAIAMVLGAWVSMRFAAYDALDAIWARKSFTYQQKMEYLQRTKHRAYGIGAGTGLLLAVPIVNLFAMPLGATAATRLYRSEPSR